MLLLKGRHKDGVERQRAVSRVPHSPEDFDRTLRELADMAQPGEQIYASTADFNGQAVRRLTWFRSPGAWPAASNRIMVTPRGGVVEGFAHSRFFARQHPMVPDGS